MEIKKMELKVFCFVLLFISGVVPSVFASELEEPEIIWVGQGAYVYREPRGATIGSYDTKQIDLLLYQQGTEKFFVLNKNNDIRYTDFYKNPDYTKKSGPFLTQFAYIINSKEYGKIYTNPEMDGDPMDYYSAEKKKSLGIVGPIYVNAFKKNEDGKYVTDTKLPHIKIVLHRIEGTDDYYATYEGKKYEVFESESPQTFIKDDYQYYGITYNNRKYLFHFNKIKD